MSIAETHPPSERENEIPQYGVMKLLLVWAAAAVPMGILGWVVAPSLMSHANRPGFERAGVLLLGLIWQFILIVILLRQETKTLTWSAIRHRLWLRPPISPRTGGTNKLLWWWILPVVVATAIYQLKFGGAVQRFWVSTFPFLAEPAGFSFNAALGSPELRATIKGDWSVFFIVLVSSVFNTVLGEELLFRGLLLPRMAGVFGKKDWIANGVMFGFYHLHQPWGMLMSTLQGVFLFSFPSRYFRSAWFGIIAHSGQSLYLSFLILGLVLGMA